MKAFVCCSVFLGIVSVDAFVRPSIRLAVAKPLVQAGGPKNSQFPQPPNRASLYYRSKQPNCKLYSLHYDWTEQNIFIYYMFASGIGRGSSDCGRRCRTTSLWLCNITVSSNT